VSANGHDSDADALAKNLKDPSVCGAETQIGPDCRAFWGDQKDAHDDRRRAQVSFIGAGIASAATLGYALYLLLDSDDPPKPGAKLSTRQIEPGLALGPDGASFSLQGQF